MGLLHRKYFVSALCAPLGTMLPVRTRAAEQYTLRLGFPQPAGSVQGVAGIHFAQGVQRPTKGQVKVEVFPSGQLASEASLIDALATGVVDFAIHAASWVEGMLPRYQVLGMPFLFKNEAAGHKVLDGPVGRELLADLEPRGLIGYGWTGAFRELYTASRPIVRPDDMKGLRVRIPGGVVGVSMYQALGALAVSIDLAEIITSLNQHVVDGIDTIIDAFTGQKFYAAAKYANMLNHILSVNILMGSRRKIEALPPELQRAIRDEGRASLPFWRSLILRQTADDVEILKRNGVVFTDPQFAAFRKAVDPVYAAFAPKIGVEFLERASRAAGSGQT